MNIIEKKKFRFLFLNKLYEITDGSTNAMVSMFELGEELNFDDITTTNIAEYLIGENLIKPKALGGEICITHKGVQEIEEAYDKPEKPTDHFPPVNIINIGSMHNSAIQQGTTNSNQQHTYNQQEQAKLSDVIMLLEQIKSEFKADNENFLELTAEIETLKIQNNSPKPKRAIIIESIKSARTLLEGISVNVLSPGLVDMMSSLL